MMLQYYTGRRRSSRQAGSALLPQPLARRDPKWLAPHVRLTTSLLLVPALCLPAHHGDRRRNSCAACSRQWRHVSRAEIGAQRRQRERLRGRAYASPVATAAAPTFRITLRYTCARALSRVSAPDPLSSPWL